MDVDASGNGGEEPGEPDPPGAAGLSPREDHGADAGDLMTPWSSKLSGNVLNAA